MTDYTPMQPAQEQQEDRAFLPATAATPVAGERGSGPSEFLPAHRAEDHQASAQPPAEQAALQRPNNKRLFIGLGIAGLVVVGGAATAIAANLGGSAGKSITVHGTMALTDIEGFTADDPNTDSTSNGVTGPCHALGGYDDIAEGAQVVFSDDSGKTLTIAHLGAGAFDANGACSFPFTATVPAGKKFYGVTASHRGTVKMSESEVSHAAVTLG
jgi:hypothetical protein